MSTRHRFALVLAAGDGTRLRSLTLDAAGVAVPKQFCTPSDGSRMGTSTGPTGRSLLATTLARAERIVPRSRITSVVAEGHRSWWQPELSHLPSGNIVVQPANRGTAAGILLPLLEIVRRDPRSSVLVLPSDHFVADEAPLAQAALQAIELVEREPDRIALLGITPDQADPDLGWLVPGPERERHRSVRRFLEKPESSLAAELFEQGALWNSFLFAAKAETLLRRFERRLPGLAGAMFAARERGRIDALYAELPSHDFSRRILEGAEEQLSLITVPPCGWSDLGTPERIAGRGMTLRPPTARPRTPAPSRRDRPEVWQRMQLAF